MNVTGVQTCALPISLLRPGHAGIRRDHARLSQAGPLGFMIEAFRGLYGAAAGLRVFRAPGRVNLIGEHTDYNLGFVLPVALDLATSIATAPSGDDKLRIHSEDRGETREFDAASLAAIQPSHAWTDYPIGVAQQLIAAGFPIEPANLLIRSTVPEGSGLSSSRSEEHTSELAFLRGRPIDPLRP